MIISQGRGIYFLGFTLYVLYIELLFLDLYQIPDLTAKIKRKAQLEKRGQKR